MQMVYYLHVDIVRKKYESFLCHFFHSNLDIVYHVIIYRKILDYISILFDILFDIISEICSYLSYLFHFNIIVILINIIIVMIYDHLYIFI